MGLQSRFEDKTTQDLGWFCSQSGTAVFPVEGLKVAVKMIEFAQGYDFFSALDFLLQNGKVAHITEHGVTQKNMLVEREREREREREPSGDTAVFELEHSYRC